LVCGPFSAGREHQLNGIFFERNGKRFAVNFIRRKKVYTRVRGGKTTVQGDNLLTPTRLKEKTRKSTTEKEDCKQPQRKKINGFH
jgi:hypothetical protein